MLSVVQILVLWLCAYCGEIFSFTAPEDGDFGFDVYDIVVNKILGGPIGFVGAIVLIVWGATKIVSNWMFTLGCFVAGTIVIRADALVQTLGAVV